MDEITSGMGEYTPDLYTLEDEEGNELQFELVDILNFEGEKYFGLTPYVESEEDVPEDGELVILKSKFEGDEELMVTIDDEDEYERVGEAFLDFLAEKYGSEED
ncbi:MAG: DUF1292 domain-containing protein [Oscillospiraceae bacterium]|jgi:uncharacterized protein YrzB (UPF0473 family)|nr:DUF1292 domain-containing protein [Oscillospiraceae bacterium]